jgi:hypothetical protein
MNGARTLKILSWIAFAAFLAFWILDFRHYAAIPDVLNAQNKAEWLRRREFYQAGAIVTFVSGLLLDVAAYFIRRRNSRQLL